MTTIENEVQRRIAVSELPEQAVALFSLQAKLRQAYDDVMGAQEGS
jgi:hypothetical protein